MTMSDITTLSDHDYVMGRGSTRYRHEGNERFRALVWSHLAEYVSAPKKIKPEIAKRILGEWKTRDPPGRFLELGENDPTQYREVKERARHISTIGQCFQTFRRPDRRSLIDSVRHGPPNVEVGPEAGGEVALQGGPSNPIEARGEPEVGLSQPSLSLRNCFGVKQAKSLAAELKRNTTLMLLRLNCRKIGVEGVEAIANALTTNNTLKVLVMSPLLKRCPGQKSMSQYGSGIGDSGAVALASSLEGNMTLKVLDLRGNSIGDEGVVALARSLKKKSALTELHLNENDISSTGAASLASVFKHGSPLKELHLSFNDIDDGGASALSDALRENTSLRVLKLNGNKIGYRGASAMSRLLQGVTGLTELDLNGNTVGDTGCVEVAKALKANMALKRLDLGCNGIGDKGACALSDALGANSTLTDLHLIWNEIGTVGAIALLREWERNDTFTILRLKGNPSTFGTSTAMNAEQGTEALLEALTAGEVVSPLPSALVQESAFHQMAAQAGANYVTTGEEEDMIVNESAGQHVEKSFEPTSIVTRFHKICSAFKSGVDLNAREIAFREAAIAAGLNRCEHPEMLEIDERELLCRLADEHHIPLNKHEKAFLQMGS
jgi:Ran GTPase-activating protein (RanGAP) involved in mRNA processing and transport